MELTAPGYLVATTVCALYHAVAELATPVGRWSRSVDHSPTHSPALALRVAIRRGPLASLGDRRGHRTDRRRSRVGGVVLLTWVVFQTGVALGALIRRLREPGPPRSASRRPGCSPLRPSSSSAQSRRRVAAPASTRHRRHPGGGEQGEPPRRRGRLRTARRGDAPSSRQRARPRPVARERRRRPSVRRQSPSCRRGRGGGRLGVPISVGVTEDVGEAEPLHQRPGDRHPEGDVTRPLRQGPPGALRRIRTRAAARRPRGTRSTRSPRRHRRHRAGDPRPPDGTRSAW